MKHIVLCIPTMTKPHQATLDSIAASVPLLDKAGYKHSMVSEIGCPYISCARATMLRKALDAKADIIIFIDHDVSWKPKDLLTLIGTEAEVALGTYRFKKEEEVYMGHILTWPGGTPMVREDGLIKSFDGPAGFLKVTTKAINIFCEKFPELLYGDRHTPHIDLFNHGAHEGTWYGEDYAMCRRFREAGVEILTVPNLDINHHDGDKIYEGNFHEFLLRQPGGSNDGQ